MCLDGLWELTVPANLDGLYLLPCVSAISFSLQMLMETWHLYQVALPTLLINDLFLQGGGQTNAGRVRRTFGGVGRNLAGASCLGLPVGACQL